MFEKPHGCDGCTLQEKGKGFLHPAGPAKAKILFVGEAAGHVEALRGYAFEGPAGGMLNKLLYFRDLDRKSVRIYNTVNCQPPGDWLDGAPWEFSATAHCAPYLERVLDEGPAVVVTLGGSALRRVLDLPKRKGDGITVKDFHGTVNEDPRGRGFWVVPTFHPSHLLRGAGSLTGVVLDDIATAQGIARNGFKRPQVFLQEDPPVAWVRAAIDILRQRALAAPGSIWCAVDVETPDKQKKSDEGELTTEDISQRIVRINFSWALDEGISFVFEGPYVALALEILSLPLVFCFWNKLYDVPRLLRAGATFGGPQLDFMVAWHVLQSDVPKGLGFVAPFYSDLLIAWKHLSGSRPAYYGCLDGIQTNRIAHGITEDLVRTGQWDAFWRHMHLVREYAFTPSSAVGLLIDREETLRFQAELAGKQETLEETIKAQVPESVLRLFPKEGWKDQDDEGVAKLNETRARKGEPKLFLPILNRVESKMVQICRGCDAIEISKTHRCKGDGQEPRIELGAADVYRLYCREEFNPGSWQQVLSYMKAKGHKPGKNRKTKGDTTDKKTIDRLARSTGDPFYNAMKLHREVSKVKGTYVDGTLRRLDDPNGPRDGRLHPTVTDNPSMFRTSYVDPNLQNVVADKTGGTSVAAGFRRCIIAAPGHKLIEADKAAIEAVFTGYSAGDPVFIRLAKLGVHAYFCSLAPDVNLPASLEWSDDQLAKHFKMLKKDFFPQYDREKRTTYLSLYGGTPAMMNYQFPDIYPTQAAAEKAQAFFYSKAPLVKKFHATVREIADKRHALPPPRDAEASSEDKAWPGQHTVHPWGYRHWFWDVLNYKPCTEDQYKKRVQQGKPVARLSDRPYSVHGGHDWKRTLAYEPQSFAAGAIREDSLQLFDPDSKDFIGATFHGATPLRALIHDSFLLEVPDCLIDLVIERLVRVMTRPLPQFPLPEEWGFGPFLSIGVEVKVGQNWGGKNLDPARGALNPEGMEVVDISKWLERARGVEGDTLVSEDDETPEDVAQAITSALQAGAA